MFLTLALAAPAVASADGRAFTVLGTDSKFGGLPSRGSALATEVGRDVRALTALPDWRIAVLGVAGMVSVIDMQGRIVDLVRLPSPIGGDPEFAGYDLEYLADGSLLAVYGGQVHRVDLSGEHRVVETGDAFSARGVQPHPDGGFLLAARNRVVHVLEDGTVRPIAGSGRAGRPREGPATMVPAGHPIDVLQLPDGSVAFTEDARRTVWVVREGNLRHFAGGGRDFRDIPRRGRPAKSVSLLFGYGGELLWLGAGGLAFMSEAGLLAVRSGRIRPIVRGTWDTPQGAPPLWAGSGVRESCSNGPGGVDRTSAGELVLSGAHSVVLHTRSDRSARLAAAINTSSQRTVWQRHVDVTVSRPAHVRVRARVDDRTVAEISADLQPGRSRLRLRHRLPSGVNRLELRAIAIDGAIATHRLDVLGSPRLPLAVARRALMSEAYHSAGDAFPIARRWRRLGPRRLRCRLSVGSEGEIFSRTRPTVSLARTGWITVREDGRRYRLEVL